MLGCWMLLVFEEKWDEDDDEDMKAEACPQVSGVWELCGIVYFSLSTFTLFCLILSNHAA